MIVFRVSVLALFLCQGCYLSHESFVSRDASSNDSATISVDTGMSSSIDGGIVEVDCPLIIPIDPECVETDFRPTIGENPFCPADHDWVPAMARQWGIARYVAVERCQRWVRCNWEPSGGFCFHCQNAFSDFVVWENQWCNW